jgi:hypothetical protein
MNWRPFQSGFFVGTILAIYSGYAGATAFKSMADFVGCGLLFGFTVEALWSVLKRRRSTVME